MDITSQWLYDLELPAVPWGGFIGLLGSLVLAPFCAYWEVKPGKILWGALSLKLYRRISNKCPQCLPGTHWKQGTEFSAFGAF